MNIELYNSLHNELMNRLVNNDITVEQAKNINDSLFDECIIIDDLEIYDESVKDILSKGIATARKYINQEAIAEMIDKKIEYVRRNQIMKKDIDSSKLKDLNDAFKKENYDDMTKMKYLRFRREYQNKRDSILSARSKELNMIGSKFNIDINKANVELDEDKRRKSKSELLAKNNKERHKVIEKYDKIIREFKDDFRYRIQQCGLKWVYIIHDKMEIN